EGKTKPPLVGAVHRAQYVKPLEGKLLKPLEVADTLVNSPQVTVRSTRKGAKEYKSRLEAGSVYVIDMRSPKIDSYLVLKGDDGKEVAWDDDSGGDLNARIRYACKTTGEYTVVATTFDGRPGPYHLTITQFKPIEAVGEVRAQVGTD